MAGLRSRGAQGRALLCGLRNTRAGAGRSRDPAAGAAPRRTRGRAFPSAGAATELLPLGGCALQREAAPGFSYFPVNEV